jgi:hypothetical protein
MLPPMRPANWLMAAALCGVLLGSSTAWAGELLVGAEPIEVGDDGNITKAAKGKAVAELESSVPGDEAWTLYIWAKIDNPAVGPIYLEFYRNHDGRELMAHRVGYEEYEGDKFISMDVEITRTEGFRSGETLDVAFVQHVGGKDVKKAKGKITLLKSSKPMPKAEEAAPEEEEKDPNEAKEIAETPASESEPPAVESGDKKGCTLGGVAMSPWLLLPLVALRRRSARHAQP